MAKVHVLPKALCDQISAGEVLERAASAVKELVENSLDAGATSIEIELEEGGRRRLSVCDDGCGMTAEDARLCVLRHATSKISRTEDLAYISTMGFRGEALASMAAVSRMSLTTQMRDDATGTYLRVEGAEILECRETAAPPGTQIVLEDLFYNTPARLKFLKTPATEMRRVYEVVEQFALACPDVRWRLVFDGRVKCEFPRHGSLRERALAVFGRSMYEHLYEIEPLKLGDVSVDGLYCDPQYLASASGRSYTFVNRRIVKDRTIQSAVSAAYREFLNGRQPCVVLFLTVPLDQVDVNVHPTKHEVRFQSPDNVFRAVQRALRQSLSLTPWVGHKTEADGAGFTSLPDAAFRSPEAGIRPRVGEGGGALSPGGASVRDGSVPVGTPALGGSGRDMADVERDVSDQLGSIFDVPYRTAGGSNAFASIPGIDRAFETAREELRACADLLGESRQLSIDESGAATASSSGGGYFSNLRYIGQHALTYLICSDGDSLVIVDQHAAHERINYERLRRVSEDIIPASSQGLLFPILLKLDPRLSDVLDEYMSFFERLGFQIDAIGNHSHVLRAVPDALSGYDYFALMRDALTDLAESGRASQFDDIHDNIIATMACHSSIRAGNRLTAQEVAELFRQMDETGFRSNCPHGRPVHFVLPLSELEKRFLRT